MSGQIIVNFQTIIVEARKACTAMGRGLRGVMQRRWFFSQVGTPPGKFDFDAVHKLFNRDEAEANFVTAMEQPATHTRQDQAIAKVQSDLLSGMERDYILRHRSRIRRIAHEAVSKAHNGSARGVFNNNLLKSLELQTQRVGGNNGSP